LAVRNWDMFNGWCVHSGVRPLKLDYADFCDLVYYWASRNATEAEQAKLDEYLGDPPEGEEAEAPGWSYEEQMAAFNSF
jgi:hypothetical protein